MKLAPLLAQYLYTNKKLNLEGIGTFLLDPSAQIEPETNKQNKIPIPDGISFINNPSLKEDEALVNYISAEAGKMKTLAASDLHSFLELATQFLNIGKPFQLEGIGILVKAQNGRFEFTPGFAIPEKSRESKETKDPSANITGEDSFTGYSDMFSKHRVKKAWKKPVLVILVLAGFALAIWGGYTVYKNSSLNEEPVKKDETVLVADTLTDKIQDSSLMANDSPSNQLPAINNQPLSTGYKFILEVADKKKAQDRYNQLKGYKWDVQLGMKDSAHFRVFLEMPASATDTLRIRDSLSKLIGKRVYIEK